MYTIIDLIDKFIEIENKGLEIYRATMNLGEEDFKIKSIAMTLAKEEERHIKYYEALKRELSDKAEEIDFIAYDKASFLVNKYKENISIIGNFRDIKDILQYALDFEKHNLALIIDIQGRIVNTEKASTGVTYKILNRIIEEESKHINNLLPFVD